LIASFLRFLGGYSIGFWGANFFTKVYPDYVAWYSVLNACITIFGGMPSSFIGGVLGDRFEFKYP